MELTPLGSLLYALSPANNILGIPRYRAIVKNMEKNGFTYTGRNEDDVRFIYEDVEVSIYFCGAIYFSWRVNGERICSKIYRFLTAHNVAKIVKRILFEDEYKGCKGRYEYIQKQKNGEIPMPRTHPNFITRD